MNKNRRVCGGKGRAVYIRWPPASDDRPAAPGPNAAGGPGGAPVPEAVVASITTC